MPPQNVNLGYDFSEKLGTVAQTMASNRKSSSDTSFSASGEGDSQEFSPVTGVAGRTGSITSNPPPQQAQQQETVAVSSELPNVPTTTSAAAETKEAAAEGDDLLIRLARLKGLPW
jgi:hypothetical protein